MLYFVKISDCQNRFSSGTSMSNENMEKSNSDTTKNQSFQAEPSGTNTARSRQSVFGPDAYKTISKSLFDTVRASHEENHDPSTRGRRLLETFHAQLLRLGEELEKNKKSNPK